jgi:hypothetical protein
MRTKLFTSAILICMNAASFAEEITFRVTKEKIMRHDSTVIDASKHDAEFRVTSIPSNSALPVLVIPTYSSGRRRVVDVHYSKDRIEVAIQVDELGIDYSDYKLADRVWTLQSKKRVCTLNGALALALAQVDILDGGVVEIKYHDESSIARKSSWNDELINKDHKPNQKLNSERYTLKEGEFRLVGAPAKLRPKSDVPHKIEEQNKTQQDNR